MKKLKDLLKESYVWERKFGEKLPTLADIQNKKNDESKIVKKKNVNEVNFDKIKLPSVVNRFLNKFVDAMKSANLNRIKRSAVLYKVIDASGMSPQQLMADIQKVKKELQKEGGPGSGPNGNGDEDNPFDREPSDDEMADIEKEFEGKDND